MEPVTAPAETTAPQTVKKKTNKKKLRKRTMLFPLSHFKRVVNYIGHVYGHTEYSMVFMKRFQSLIEHRLMRKLRLAVKLAHYKINRKSSTRHMLIQKPKIMQDSDVRIMRADLECADEIYS